MPLSRDNPKRETPKFLIWQLESRRRRSIPFSFLRPPVVHRSIIQPFNFCFSRRPYRHQYYIDRKLRLLSTSILFSSLLCEFLERFLLFTFYPTNLPNRLQPRAQTREVPIDEQNRFPCTCSEQPKSQLINSRPFHIPGAPAHTSLPCLSNPSSPSARYRSPHLPLTNLSAWSCGRISTRYILR